MKQKISQYLNTLSSHDIYDHESLAEDFKKETGVDPCWPIRSGPETIKAIENRGLGGELSVKAAQKLAYGYQIAEAFAVKLLNYSSPYEGRGRRFNAAIEALKEAGF